MKKNLVELCQKKNWGSSPGLARGCDPGEKAGHPYSVQVAGRGRTANPLLLKEREVRGGGGCFLVLDGVQKIQGGKNNERKGSGGRRTAPLLRERVKGHGDSQWV